MPIRLLHTADIHLGMKFTRGYEADVRDKLIQARVDVVGRLVQIANDQQCDLLVIAGDLFHNTKPATKDIKQTARQLKNFIGQVLILPGNHDFYDADTSALWPRFTALMGENMVVMKDQEALLISVGDQQAAIYPGPCLSNHSSTNAIGWVMKARSKTEANFHIGIAHGNLDGVTPDFNAEYFPMTNSELEATGVSLWLLGHAHIRYPNVEAGSGELALFASTPEPDGFDCRHEGSTWIVTLDDGGGHSYEAMKTGQYQFHDVSKNVMQEKDLKDLGKAFEKLDPSKDLVKLKLEGRLGSESYSNIGNLLNDLGEMVFYLEDDNSDLLRQITQSDIDREFTRESFPHRLLTTLVSDGGDALSLQIAYELIQGVRS